MPVWPTCFWICWPMPPGPPMRLPAANTPMSRIVTPPSASAPIAASAARSTVSLSGCLPNLVMWIPRIQTSSFAMSLRLSALDGLDVDHVGAHRRPVAVDEPSDEGHRDAGRGQRHDGERPQLALRRHRNLL